MDKKPELNSKGEIKKLTVNWKWVGIIVTGLIIYMSIAAYIYVVSFGR